MSSEEMQGQPAHSKAPLEFEGIFEPQAGNRPVMSMPPRMMASKLFISEVRDALEIPEESAQEAADWIANKMERFAAQYAQPVFDMDGNGPMCSMCSMIWPLCGHHHLSYCRDGFNPSAHDSEAKP